MKKLIFLFVLGLLISETVVAQPERIGAGLTFAAKKRFNGGDTGNPGLNLKTWISVDKRKMLYIVPSATVFNPLEVNHTSHQTTNYMFHGDLDVQYTVVHDNTLKLVAIAGMNYTHIISKNNIEFLIPGQVVVDSTVSGFGPAIGAALEMRMSPFVDFIVTGKYSFAGLRAGDTAIGEPVLVTPLASPIIQIHAVYYFISRGRGYSRR